MHQTENTSKGSFFMEENGAYLAKLTYFMVGTNLMRIDHNNIDDR